MYVLIKLDKCCTFQRSQEYIIVCNAASMKIYQHKGDCIRSSTPQLSPKHVYGMVALHSVVYVSAHEDSGGIYQLGCSHL